jgi:hypothetical protein
VDRTGVGRRLDHDHVARVDEDAAEQVDHLLRAGRDHQLGRHGRAAEPRLHPRAQRLDQRAVPLGCAVLQDVAAQPREHLGPLGELGDREDRRVGQAAGERDHARPPDHRVELADR